MNAMTAGGLDGLLSAAAGIWVALVGFGVIDGTKEKAKAQNVREKYGKLFRIGGILITFFGIWNIVRSLLSI